MWFTVGYIRNVWIVDMVRWLGLLNVRFTVPTLHVGNRYGSWMLLSLLWGQKKVGMLTGPTGLGTRTCARVPGNFIHSWSAPAIVPVRTVKPEKSACRPLATATNQLVHSVSFNTGQFAETLEWLTVKTVVISSWWWRGCDVIQFSLSVTWNIAVVKLTSPWVDQSETWLTTCKVSHWCPAWQVFEIGALLELLSYR